MADTNIVDATISDLEYALASRSITSVELVAKYLCRIAKYDYNDPSLNSVCVLNSKVFEDALALDQRRLSQNMARHLKGTPFTVKDSFKVKGMTAAAGSPAFINLVASKDAAIIDSLRNAGAIVIRETNMPAMADREGQRGLYGRAEGPYNLQYLPAAYASDSSNGAGTSTAASFAAFGSAGEKWPLYPTCDIVVPLTGTMTDLFTVLDSIVVRDSARSTDLWSQQKIVKLPSSDAVRPETYHSLTKPSALCGKRLGVLRIYLGYDHQPGAAILSQGVRELWNQARADLEALGANIVETDFPLAENYAKGVYGSPSANIDGLSEGWPARERCLVIALGWDDFLKSNQDPKYPDLKSADPDLVRPKITPLDGQTRHTKPSNHVRYIDMVQAVLDRPKSLLDVPGCGQALLALGNARKRDLDEWLDKFRP